LDKLILIYKKKYFVLSYYLYFTYIIFPEKIEQRESIAAMNKKI